MEKILIKRAGFFCGFGETTGELTYFLFASSDDNNNNNKAHMLSIWILVIKPENIVSQAFELFIKDVSRPSTVLPSTNFSNLLDGVHDFHIEIKQSDFICGRS